MKLFFFLGGGVGGVPLYGMFLMLFSLVLAVTVRSYIHEANMIK